MVVDMLRQVRKNSRRWSPNRIRMGQIDSRDVYSEIGPLVFLETNSRGNAYTIEFLMDKHGTESVVDSNFIVLLFFLAIRRV